MEILDFGIYTVDENYIKILHDIDSEVYYDGNNYDRKPYIGIMMFTGKYDYFIPLTSAKPKHADWDIFSRESYLVYEVMPKSKIRPKWVYKVNPDDTVNHILSVLDIKKMVPVPAGCFSKVIFSDLTDKGYAMLLMKEYRYLKPHSDKILNDACDVYNRQIKTGKINRFSCNFKLLETACDNYSKHDKSTVSSST